MVQVHQLTSRSRPKTLPVLIVQVKGSKESAFGAATHQDCPANLTCMRVLGPGLLGRQSAEACHRVVESDVLSTMLALISSVKHKVQLCGLRVVASLAFTSEEACTRLLTPAMIKQLQVDPGACLPTSNLPLAEDI